MLPDLEDRDDARMIEPCGRLRLAAEPGEIGLAREIATEQHLDRNGSAQAPLHGTVDDAHAAAADLGEQFIVTKGRRQQRHARHERARPHVRTCGR